MKELRMKILERWLEGATNPDFTNSEEFSIKQDLLALMAEVGAIIGELPAGKVPHPLGGFYGEPEPACGPAVDAVLRTLEVGLNSMRRAIDGSVYCTPEVQKQFERDIPEYENALRILKEPSAASMNSILKQVVEEREKQDEKWGVQKHGPMTWLAILAEEFGETAKAILEGDGTRYVKELVQIAAVAVATLECFYRGETALVSIMGIQLEVKNLRERLDAYRKAGPLGEALAGLGPGPVREPADD